MKKISSEQNDKRSIKVALLFFGLPRYSEICIPSIEDKIIRQISKEGARLDIEIKFNLYKQSHVFNRRSNENGKLDYHNYDWFLKYQGQLADPVKTLEAQNLVNLRAQGDPYGDDGASLRNLMLQLHSLHKMTEDFAAGSFDVAVFLRPDLIYHDPLPVSIIDFASRHPKACVLPGWQSWGGYNDRFAICGRTAAIAYGSRIKYVEEFCKETNQSLHAEKLLKYVIQKESLKVRLTSMKASRVRISGIVKHENFDISKTASRSISVRLELIYLRLISTLIGF